VVSLSAQERQQFSFLFDHLDKANCDNLDVILDGLKAKGVPMDTLAVFLSGQLASDKARETDSIEAVESLEETTRLFDEVCGRVRKAAPMLDAPELGVRPPALIALLDACSAVLRIKCIQWSEGLNLRKRMNPKLGRVGGPERPLVDEISVGGKVVKLEALHTGGQDLRDLRKLVRSAAARWRKRRSQAGDLAYAIPAPCPHCGNPAPLLWTPPVKEKSGVAPSGPVTLGASPHAADPQRITPK
jgi:hypothetical protein